MSSPGQRVEHIFIVRMWYERRPEGDSEWRGSVEHAASRDRIYFTNLVALTDFLEANVSGLPPPSG